MHNEKDTNLFKRIMVSILAYAGVLTCFAFIFLAIQTCAQKIGIVLSGYMLAVCEIVVLFLLVLAFSACYGMVRRKDSFEFIKRLATFPGRHNYHWAGGFSLFTCIILYSITVFRAISGLQLCKQVYRKLISSGRDIKSKRPNVSPLFQEGYFFVWAMLIGCEFFFGCSHPVLRGMNVYFIIESLVWILYYSVFRRFYEENYSIYHVLEHLPLIIFLIPLQAIAYAMVIMGAQGVEAGYWRDVLVVLLGQAENNKILFSFIGFLYSAIVISMILSMFPAENIKHGIPDTIIVGAGDVVRKRFLPALLKRMADPANGRGGNIDIFDLKVTGPVKELLDEESRKRWDAANLPEDAQVGSIYSLIGTKFTSDDRIVWICTPSDTHWYYLDMLQTGFDYIAVEKPITSNRDELVFFKEYAAGPNRSRTFFLSYYLLDKALPLTFLCRPRALYLKYLKGDEEFYQSYLESSGSGVARFEMSILEGEDNRPIPQNGQWIETFLHNCLIASMFAGLPSSWSDVTSGETGSSKLWMKAKGANGCDIDLVLEKDSRYNAGRVQSAKITFNDSAVIEADFVKKTSVYKKDRIELHLDVSDEYSEKYEVQCNIVYDCYANKISPADVDGLYHQIEVLEWLFERLNG